MTVTTEPRALTDLTRDLADFLDLPETLDLPKLYTVQIARHHGDSDWKITAQVMGQYSWNDAAEYEKVSAWAAACGGGDVVLGPVHAGGSRGTWRMVSTTVSFVGMGVEVWSQVAGTFVAPSDVAADFYPTLPIETPLSPAELTDALLVESAGGAA